jgi:hypothetical protein
MIHADEEIIAGDNQHSRVLAVVTFDEEDESPFAGLLRDRLRKRTPSSADPDGNGRSVPLRGPFLRLWERMGVPRPGGTLESIPRALMEG